MSKDCFFKFFKLNRKFMNPVHEKKGQVSVAKRLLEGRIITIEKLIEGSRTCMTSRLFMDIVSLDEELDYRPTQS